MLMQRREFITFCAAAAWLPVTRAQQTASSRRVGVLLTMTASDPGAQPRAKAIEEGLADVGWRKGYDVQIEYRWAGGNLDSVVDYAAELVASKPDVILAVSPAAVAALRQKTSTTPIVFVQVPDPVGSGFVSSLAKPDANITGFTTFEYSAGGKWLELLKQMAPKIQQVFVIVEVEGPGYSLFLQTIEASAPTLQVKISTGQVHDAADIKDVIGRAAREPNSGLIVLPSAVAVGNRQLIVALTAQHGLPAVYPFRFFVAEGGLLSYGIASLDVFQRAGSYVGRILSGEKPNNLPVQNPSKFELVVNLKTAKALGLEVPPNLLAIADEVIE